MSDLCRLISFARENPRHASIQQFHLLLATCGDDRRKLADRAQIGRSAHRSDATATIVENVPDGEEKN
jgi:hypothetical protein